MKKRILFSILALASVGLLGTYYYTVHHVTSIFLIATGDGQGCYYKLGGKIANRCNTAKTGKSPHKLFDNFKVYARSSHGSHNNLKLLYENTVHVAIIQADLAQDSYEGVDNVAKFESLRSIGHFYSEFLYILVPENSSIHKVEDLKGKTLFLHDSKSGTYSLSDSLLNAHGLSSQEISLFHGHLNKAINAFKKGEVSAIFITAPYAGSRIKNLLKLTKARLLSVEKRAVQKLLENKNLSYLRLPEGIFNNTNKLGVIATGAHIYTTTAVPDDKVYEFLKRFWDLKLDQSFKVDDIYITVHLDASLVGESIPFHNGAIKFYKERRLML